MVRFGTHTVPKVQQSAQMFVCPGDGDAGRSEMPGYKGDVRVDASTHLLVALSGAFAMEGNHDLCLPFGEVDTDAERSENIDDDGGGSRNVRVRM